LTIQSATLVTEELLVFQAGEDTIIVMDLRKQRAGVLCQGRSPLAAITADSGR
jgi:hypothetical protein